VLGALHGHRGDDDPYGAAQADPCPREADDEHTGHGNATADNPDEAEFLPERHGGNADGDEGAPATMLEVPAGTESSPVLSSSWYAVIPKKAHATTSARSRAAGRRTLRNGAAPSSTDVAMLSRTKESPITPKSGVATPMAGKALAQSATTLSPASNTRGDVMTEVCVPRIVMSI
jgi:hypothetical protein